MHVHWRDDEHDSRVFKNKNMQTSVSHRLSDIISRREAVWSASLDINGGDGRAFAQHNLPSCRCHAVQDPDSGWWMARPVRDAMCKTVPGQGAGRICPPIRSRPVERAWDSTKGRAKDEAQSSRWRKRCANKRRPGYIRFKRGW